MNLYEVLHFSYEGAIKTLDDKVTMGGLSLSGFSSVLLFQSFTDISAVIGGLGAAGGALAVIKNGISAYREYVALKLDKAKANKMMKELEDNVPNNDKDILKDNGSNI